MTQEQFIKEIAKYVVKYAPQYNIKVHSPIIAQAILESASGTSELAVNACNYFGLKYRANRCPSACGVYYKIGSEQNADGSYTSSAMQWMKFANMEDGVRGYFDFVNISTYKSLKGVTDPETYLKNIKAAGYATSLKYVENLLKVIKQYNLTQYDISTKDTNTNNKPSGYTNSPLATYVKISPNKTSPRNHKIDTITIHCMAGNLSIESCGNVFAPESRKASSNYGVGSDGRIAMYVEEKDRSWCSSSSQNDHRAITIEVANDGGAPYWHVSDKAMESLIALCADICERNDIKQLVWSTNKINRVNRLNGCNMTVHRDFANKACPGDYLYSKHGYIANEVNKRLGAYTPTIKNVVNVGTVLNVRNKPNGYIIGKLVNDTEIKILDYQDGWFKIGDYQWVSSDYIYNVTGVVTDNLNIRSGAGMSYSDIGDLKKDETVRICGEQNGWYMILSSTRQFGWASSEYIKLI